MAFIGLLSFESLKLILFSIISYFIYVYLIKPIMQIVHLAIHYHGFPTSPRHFILGHLKLFWTNFPFPCNFESVQRNLFEVVDWIAAHTPTQPLSVTWASIYPVITVTSHESVEIVLNKKNIKKPYIYKFLGQKFGLIASDPDIWKVRRKLIEPFFTTKRLKAEVVPMNKEVESFCQKLESEVGKPIDLEHQIHRSTLNIILQSIASIPTDNSDEKGWQKDKDIINELQKEIQINTVARSVNPFYHFDWLLNFFEFGKIYYKTIDESIKHSALFLDRRKQLLSSTSIERQDKDLVGMLEGKMDEQGLCDELITMVGAGHDTTAVGLRWLLHNLGNHPEEQEKLYQEVIQFFPDDTPVDDMDKINQCNYLDGCIKESLRLNPPVHAIQRTLQEDVMVKGKKLLKGSIINVSFKPIHRNPIVYPEPDKFDPDRWSPENSSKIPKAAYIPFGYGPRTCIGYRYAILELKIYIIQVIRKYSLRSVRKHGTIPSKVEVTLKPIFPLEIIMTPRNNNIL